MMSVDEPLLAHKDGMTRKELKEVEEIINDNADLLRRKWDEHCAGTVS